MRFRHFLALHRDENNAGGGGSKEKGAQSIADRLVARYGNADAALAVLSQENFEYREEKRTLKEQLDAAKAQGLKDGEVKLSAADAKAYAAFQALNLAPEKISEALTERDAVKATLAERDRAAEIHAMATAAGFKASVLTDLAKTKGLHLELRETQVQKADGSTETQKVPHVRYAAKTDAALEPLAAFATRELADYLPSLAATAGAGATSQGAGGTAAAPLTPFAGQPAGGAAPGDAVATMLARKEQQRAQGNALVPAKAAAA